MKIKILLTGILKITALKVLILISVCSICTAQPPPTEEPNGWRYATLEDAAYWDNVAVDDVLMFGTIDSETNLRLIRRDARNGPINIEGGKKIHIWQGEYAMIRLEYYRWDGTKYIGSFVETNSSETNPVIITNLGGQVRFGGLVKYLDGNMRVYGLKHVSVTGEYDQTSGTGDADFKGLDGDLTAHGWINRFGIMGDRMFTTLQQGDQLGAGLGLTINRFLSAKVRGVAVLRGFWAGFSVKSDDLVFGHNTSIDIQRCLSGWHTNEGFYVGTAESNAEAYPANKVTFKNNVVLFAGGEGIQADKLTSGSEIKNNFVYKTACFYQAPHQAKDHEHGFQWSFVEGGVRAENNIIYCGSAGPVINISNIVAKSQFTLTTSEILLSNNLLGPSLSRLAYIHKPTASNAERVTFRIDNNIIDKMFATDQNDAYTTKRTYAEWIKLINDVSPFYLTNNIYPSGLPFYRPLDAANVMSDQGSQEGVAPPLLLHANFGFDPAEILKFRGVWLTGEYISPATSTGAIEYRDGDIVYTVKNNKTRYYRCIQTHSVVKSPTVETAYWQQITWNGQDEPTYTPLLQSGSVYHTRGMGLEYYAAPPPSGSCAETGQITREYWANVIGYNISDIPLSSPPTSTSQLTSFQGPSNEADNYGARISGYVCPPTTGDYVFWIASDDKSELWLSTDDNPANKAQIASVTVWTNPDEWTKYSTQQSAPISLVAGQKYYIEALHKEIEGSDHITVGWTLPDGTLERPIPGTRLLPFTGGGTSEPSTTWNSYDMTISSNPAEQGAIISDQGTKAVVEFYESTDDFGVTKGSLFSYHTAGSHPHSESHATNWWRISETSGNYPFAGLSTVGRGSDAGETNAPAPLDAIDLQLHPPINDKLAVAAFIVPKAGTYEISKLAARRVSALPSTGGTIRFQVFDKNKVKQTELVASNNQLWVTSSGTIVLEGLAVNDRIYFATARDGNYAYDFTEISWTVTHVPSGSTTTARISSTLENDLVTSVSGEEILGVYPNPVENVIYVKGPPGKETTVKIYNSQGMEVLQERISSEDGRIGLELGNYRPGIYFMVLQSGREIQRYKFLKK